MSKKGKTFAHTTLACYGQWELPSQPPLCPVSQRYLVLSLGPISLKLWIPIAKQTVTGQTERELLLYNRGLAASHVLSWITSWFSLTLSGLPDADGR